MNPKCSGFTTDSFWISFTPNENTILPLNLGFGVLTILIVNTLPTSNSFLPSTTKSLSMFGSVPTISCGLAPPLPPSTFWKAQI